MVEVQGRPIEEEEEAPELIKVKILNWLVRELALRDMLV